MEKQVLVCPFGTEGCISENHVCMFWGKRKGCDISNGIAAIKRLPNDLKLIREALEEGKHIQ